jgi:hypothetical protein
MMQMPARIFLLLTLAALALASNAGAQATTTRVVFTEVATGGVVGSDGCLPEPVVLEGAITLRLRTTVTPTGAQLTGGHTSGHLTAIGLVTGDTYQVLDLRQVTTNLTSAFEGITSTRFLVIGGSNNNLLITNLIHSTLTPSGNVEAVFSRLMVECVGSP